MKVGTTKWSAPSAGGALMKVGSYDLSWISTHIVKSVLTQEEASKKADMIATTVTTNPHRIYESESKSVVFTHRDFHLSAVRSEFRRLGEV